MSEDTDPNRFYHEAETYMHALAVCRGLGLAQGRWDHPRFGQLKLLAVNGWIGRLYVVLIVCETDARWALGMARLWWYLNDWAEPFEFRHVVRTPMAETVINADSGLDAEIGARIRWLEKQPSIEAAWTGMYGKALVSLTHAEEAQGDIRVALAEEIPKGDEGPPDEGKT